MRDIILFLIFDNNYNITYTFYLYIIPSNNEDFNIINISHNNFSDNQLIIIELRQPNNIIIIETLRFKKKSISISMVFIYFVYCIWNIVDWIDYIYWKENVLF